MSCRRITSKSNAHQTTAVNEGIRSNAGDAHANNHTRQTTVFEGPAPNADDTVRDRHARQANAVIEGQIPNAGDAVANRHARQTTAAPEGMIPNAGDAVGDRVVTAYSSRKLNQLSFVFVEQTPVLRRIFGVTFAYLNARQTTAAIED